MSLLGIHHTTDGVRERTGHGKRVAVQLRNVWSPPSYTRSSTLGHVLFATAKGTWGVCYCASSREALRVDRAVCNERERGCEAPQSLKWVALTL
eukprot:4525608-Pyramimonas_sp.AAC.1